MASEAEAPAEGDEDGESEEAVDAGPRVELLHGVAVTEARGERVLHLAAAELLELAATLHEVGYNQLLDLCGVDYLTHPGRDLPATVTPERFELAIHLINHSTGDRLRLRVQVSADNPTAPTLFDVWPSAEALEREAYDMFGIVFDDHPDMTRILMPEDWIGHPLRKDYAVGRIPVQFKGADA